MFSIVAKNAAPSQTTSL